MPQVTSTAIASVDYDSETRQLHIVFHKTGRYTYFGVPQSVYRDMLIAPSIGEYFNDNIRVQYSAKRG